MTDPQKRIVFCNDRYLEIYGLARSDISKRHDRAGTAGAAPRSAACSTSASRNSAARRQPGRLRHRAARRAIGAGRRFPPAQRRLGRHPRGLHRAAPAVAANWPRPSSSWNWCSTMCRYASPPRASRTAATFSPTARSSASRAFPATTSSASAPMRSSGRDRSEHRGGGPGGAQLARRPCSATNSRRARREKRVLASNRVVARDEKNRAGIPDRAVRRRHRPPVAVAGTREHQEIPRTGRRQHSGVADRRARQRRTLPARQSQRRDHPQPPARGRHRPDGRRYLQSAGSQADHRARRGGDQEARPAHRGTSDLHQGRAAAVPDPPHDRARRCRRAAIPDQDP